MRPTSTPRRSILTLAMGTLLPAAARATALEVTSVARDLPFAPLSVAIMGRDLLVGSPSGLWALDQAGGKPVRAPWLDSDAPVNAVAASGTWVATASRSELRVYDWTERRLVWSTAKVTSISSIAIAADGALIATDRVAGHVLRVERERVSLVAGGLHRPVGVFVDGTEDGWVTEYAAGRVTYAQLTSGLTRPLVFALSGPTAVAKLNTGNLAVMEPNFGRLLTVDPKTGERTPLAGGLALAIDDLDLPPDTAGGLAVTDKDIIYAACPGDRSIVRIVPELRREKDKT